MQHARHCQHEGGDVGTEAVAVRRCHLVTAVHGADGGFEHAAAGVAERFARCEQRLFAHHALSMNFLHVAGAVGDDPMAADELRGNAAGVVDGDVVGKNVVVVFGVRLCLDEFGDGFDLDAIAVRGVHRGSARLVGGEVWYGVRESARPCRIVLFSSLGGGDVER